MLTYLSSPESIAALLPEYTGAGDHTLLYTAAGDKIATAQRPATFIRRLARTWAVDLTALKKQTALTTQRAILQPLPICPTLTLVPVKVRLPRIPGDTSIGYINVHCVTGLNACQPTNRPADPKTLICLQGGTAVSCLWTSATIQKALQQARLLTRYAQTAKHLGSLKESTVVYDPQLEPIAQKLVEVFYDILRLKEHPSG